MRVFVLVLLAAAIVVLPSCNQKMQCAAYSSYFLLDEDALNKQFTYFGEDTLPRQDISNVNKNRYGIIKKQFFVFKNWSLRTVPMEIVFPETPDSLKFQGDLLLYAEMDIPDSAQLDQPAQDWNWNVEQENYFREIKDLIVLTSDLEEEEAAQEAAEGPETSATEVGEETQEKVGFFNKLKGLFKKKDKKKKEEPVEEVPEEETEEDDDGF